MKEQAAWRHVEEPTTAYGVREALPSAYAQQQAQLEELHHRVAVLEAWIQMVAGQVLGPLSVLPTKAEAELRVEDNL
jgi:hypothetical protein